MRGEIFGFDRRRLTDEEKIGIVMSVGVKGASGMQVPQRHDVTRQQLYAWRNKLKEQERWSPDDGALFNPLDVPPDPHVPAVPDLGIQHIGAHTSRIALTHNRVCSWPGYVMIKCKQPSKKRDVTGSL